MDGLVIITNNQETRLATEPQAEWHMVVITVANKVLMDEEVAMEDISSSPIM